MINTHINILFRVEAAHSYYPNEICSGLRFAPGPATRMLQQRFGFLFESGVNGFTFHTDTKQAPGIFLQYVSDVTRQTFFDFTITATDPKFYNFTKLPSGWQGQLMYNSNAASAPDETGKIVLTQSFSDYEMSAGAGSLVIQLADILQLLKEKKEIQYQIRLTARSTQWQYYVVNNNAVPLNNPIISGKNGIEFEGPENVAIPSGQQALFFSSGNTLIPLTQEPAHRFSLMSRSASGADANRQLTAGKTVIKAMPCPDPAQYDTVFINGIKEISSPMYIFI